MIKSIILDFDGVIVESVSVKTDAFRALFSFSPEHVDEIVQFHLDNGGMSRFDKIRYIYAIILQEELTQKKFEVLSSRFAELVEEAVIKTPFVSGAPEFFQYAFGRFPLYIVSATPEGELKRIVVRRGIDRFFTRIYGSPVKKKEHIERILNENMLDPSEVLFIGDAANDWEAARQCEIRFIGRNKPGEPDRFENLPGVEQKIGDLKDLITYLETHLC